MPAGQLEEVVDRVAEIIRRVGKREEIEEEVASNVSFSSLANDLITQDGPVREAAIKVVANVLKNLEIESGSDEETAIIEGIDFKAISTEFVGDPEVREALKSSVKMAIENFDPDVLDETIDGVFGLNDSARLVEILDKKVKEDLSKIVADKVRACMEDWNTDQLKEETLNDIEKAVFTPERIAFCLDGQAAEINRAVTDCALAVIKAVDPSDADEVATQMVLESNAFKTAINDAVEKLARSGKIDRLVEEAVSSMLSSEDSVLRTKISETVSDKLVDRVAESVVSRLFERSR